MESFNLPSKSHFKAEEVTQLTGVKPYVLRFWESEFDALKPVTGSTGHKIYTAEDVKQILIIKGLLFDRKLTINEAKRELGNSSPETVTESVPTLPETVTEMPVTCQPETETAPVSIASEISEPIIETINPPSDSLYQNMEKIMSVREKAQNLLLVLENLESRLAN